MPRPWRPTPAQLAAAEGRRLRDVIAPGLGYQLGAIVEELRRLRHVARFYVQR